MINETLKLKPRFGLKVTFRRRLVYTVIAPKTESNKNCTKNPPKLVMNFVSLNRNLIHMYTSIHRKMQPSSDI